MIHIDLIEDPIDPAPMLAAAQNPSAGAVVLFLGVTRQFTAGRQTARLRYEAYADMARAEMRKLADQAVADWRLSYCALVHRLGDAPLGEASVAVVAASAHRDAAFQAGRWLIDTLKETVPIWKQEHWADGGTEWMHPEASGDERSTDAAP